MRMLAATLALPLFLAGCGLPPAIQVASLVADGVSYAVTGKSTTDHAISAVAQQDCALLRVARGEDICRPDNPFAVSTSEALVDPAALTQTEIAASIGPDRPRRRPPPGIAAPAARVQRGEFLAAKPVAKPRPAPRDEQEALDPRAEVPGGDTYTVVGSFRRIENARRAARKHDDGATIQAVRLDGAVHYRVLVDLPVEQAHANGFRDAWPLRLCPTAGGKAPCGAAISS